MSAAKPRVLVVRGQLAAPWDLQAWTRLEERFDVRYLLTKRNAFDVADVRLPAVRARSTRDFLPRGRIGEIVAATAGARYLDIEQALGEADIVHAEELSFWFSADVARRKRRYRYRLVLTVWETLPLLDAFRNRQARRYRRETLAATDLFLAATERARQGLLLEGVDSNRIVVSYPGIELDRFRAAAAPEPPPRQHVVISPGRLVWEKGHQDVMRAVAALRTGVVPTPAADDLRLLVVGDGPERGRLQQYAEELGLAGVVDFTAVPYAEMPTLYAQASCMVLASLSSAACSVYLGDPPRCFWEEQFGLVLAEAMAAGLPVVASSSGAIPEVLGPSGSYFAPGDWIGLARALAEGPLSRPPAQRVDYPAEHVERYSTEAAADRLAAAYERVLAAPANASAN